MRSLHHRQPRTVGCSARRALELDPYANSFAKERVYAPLEVKVLKRQGRRSELRAMSVLSREEERNIRMVEAFAAAQAKRSQREADKAKKLENLGTGGTQSCCSEAPSFVATEHDLMNFSDFLNRLTPAVIEAGIIKITVPEELRIKLLPCVKPSWSEFPCKVQVMRCSSKHERLGSASLVGHHFGNPATTTIENIKRRTRKMQASLG